MTDVPARQGDAPAQPEPIGRRCTTPLVWQRNIPNRAADRTLQRSPAGTGLPTPKLISCVTGEASYDEWNSRELLIDWTDHPQRLWDAIDAHARRRVESSSTSARRPT